MNLLKTFRAILTLNLLIIFVQFGLAGLMLSGTSLAHKLHGPTGLLLVAVALIQLSLVIAMRRKRICPAWLVRANAGIIVALLIEAVSGHFHILGLHVPLGVAIFGGVLRQLFWAMTEPSHSVIA